MYVAGARMTPMHGGMVWQSSTMRAADTTRETRDAYSGGFERVVSLVYMISDIPEVLSEALHIAHPLHPAQHSTAERFEGGPRLSVGCAHCVTLAM